MGGETEILAELLRQRKELSSLRFANVSSQHQVKNSKICGARKAIARVLTVLSEKRIAAARDLRKKGTRASRRLLSAHEAKKMTLKQQKTHDNFKQRKYALVA